MKNIEIINRSQFPTDELMPLLRVAYAAVKPEINFPPKKPYRVCVGHTRSRQWMMAWRRRRDCSYDAELMFAKPNRLFSETAIQSISLRNRNEMVIAVSAWAFAALMAREEVCRSCAADAIMAYRSDQAAVDGAIARVVQRKQEAQGAEFASMVFSEVAKNSLEHKLAALDKKEKVWLRKFKLAQTKLKSLRRSRSALIAADKRKQRTKRAQVADSQALPLQPTP